MPSKIKHFYEFEDFRLDAENASLWRAGQAVSIPPKALEVLILLIRRRNEIVSRDELLDAVWKDTFVEEGNINYTVSQLRKILGNKDLVQTVPRRGYRFVGEVREVSENDRERDVEKAAEPTPNESVEKFPESKGRVFDQRWILASVALVLVIFLTSFAYFRRHAKAAKPPENLPSSNSEAQQAFTRGKMILAKRAVENREEKAIDEFQNAVTFDPTFALAYAGLANGYLSLANAKSGKESLDAYAKARVAAEKSLTLDPNLAEGFFVRGWVKRQADWNWTGAEEDLRRAIQIDSRNSLYHQRLALLLCSVGRLDEALSEAQIAYELDPVADVITGAQFPVLEARREYDAALAQSEKFYREDKNNPFAARAHATFLYHKGEYQKVLELLELPPGKNAGKNQFPRLSLLAAAYQKTGQPEKAEETLQQLETEAQNNTKALYSLAMNYAELGRVDEALAALESCYAQHEERMCWLREEPRFANLQADERFQALLKKMNF